MRTLLVGYDLNRPVQDYPKLTGYLRAFGIYWHHLDSTWLIRTTLTAVQLRDQLLSYIDRNDELLVIEVTGGPAAWYGFNDSGSNWIKEQIG